jgi:hypothetical protein
MQVIENMSTAMADVQLVSHKAENPEFELIDSVELAARWRVPESWVRSRTRARTPAQERIPCVRLGRYVRFQWGSSRLSEWLARKQQ